MDLDRLRFPKRWQCALVTGVIGWVPAIVFALLIYAFTGEFETMFGALVMLFLVSIPCGMFASYLWDAGRREGAIVGGLASAVAVAPWILPPLFFFVLMFEWTGEGVGGAVLLFIFTAFLFILITIGAAALGALGGYVLGRHSDEQHQPSTVTDTDSPKPVSGEEMDSLEHDLAESPSQQGASRQRTTSPPLETPGDVDRAG